MTDLVDFERLAQSSIKLFITATNVRTGRGHVFKNGTITPDVLLASACLPTMFQAIEIDGEPYWDGGYSGNPTITPLIRECKSRDTILVQINPIERNEPARSASEILNRLNEVSFNAVLLKELRMMALLRQVADPGNSEGAQWAGMRIHRIASEMLTELGASSKLNAEWEFFLHSPARRGTKIGASVSGDACNGPREPLNPRYRRFAGKDLRHGTSRHSGRSRSLDLARVPGLECTSARSRRRRPRCRIGRRAAACPLDANLHGERRALHHAVLPDFSPRCIVRQADGG
jgi:hypothetical protein